MEFEPLLAEAEARFGWMFQTLHRPDASQIELTEHIIAREQVPDISDILGLAVA